uniref:Homeobox expressed in ES cells 1 n=1 Tax=Magallana gigas TaxID=29159 RepID=K1PYP9_MAGGI|eukprot:XP_011412796.1 PREDICTED: paired mesoderm homeobox protein 2 [Crassostrea gigas]
MGISEPKKVPTRSRIKYRQDQLETLEESFRSHQYPDSESIENLAEKVGVSSERVAIWFQNRRAKFKRESKDAQMNWMRKQFYTENQDVTVTSEKTSHLISCSPPEMHGESRLQPDYLPSKNFYYLPNSLAARPDDGNSSFSSGASSSPSPPTVMMTSPSPYSIPQRQNITEYPSSYPAFYPQYISDYQQSYFRHYAPPQPLMPVNQMHLPYTSGYQMMTLQ